MFSNAENCLFSSINLLEKETFLKLIHQEQSLQSQNLNRYLHFYKFQRGVPLYLEMIHASLPLFFFNSL